MKPEAEGRPTYTPQHFSPLFEVEEKHYWFRSRNRCIAAALRLVSESTVREVLEVGCGTGVVLPVLQRAFPHARVTGLELFEEGLVFARRRHSGPLIHGNVLTHRFDAAFDVICTFDVIEHLDDDLGVLRAIVKQLRTGGHIVLTVPAHRSLWSSFDEIAFHRRRYSTNEIMRCLQQAGVEPIYVSQFLMGLYPLMWLKRRVVDRIIVAPADPRDPAKTGSLSELKVTPIVNWVLEAITRVDPHFIKKGRHLPLGTSIIAVGVKR